MPSSKPPTPQPASPQDEDFGLEQITSDRFTTFMERSMCDEGFICPGRNVGVMSFGQSENEKATFAIGAFLNDNTIEGLRHRNLPLFSVQYHPEAAPGPHDSHYLFKDFVHMMEEFKH